MSNNDLLAEAREFLRSENAQYYDSSLIGALADALEAVTGVRVDLDSAEGVEAQIAARQPSGDDRESAFESGMESVDWDMVRDGVGDPQEAAGVAVRAALGTLAAVPDAATEKLREASEADRIRLGHLQDEVYRLEAERDAAVAAIERVRALVEAWRYGMPEYTSSTYQEGQKDQQRKLVGQLLAALDGAPEPQEKP